MKKIIIAVWATLISLVSIAQGETSTGGSFMRSNHKIFVSIAVLGIILSAIFIFLFMLKRQA